MLRALLLPIQVSFSLSCNHFIYQLQHLPWVGKKIPDRIYRVSTLKMILSMAAELARTLFGFLGALLTLAVLIIGPMYAMNRNLAGTDLFYHYYFFIFFLVVPLGTNIIFQTRDITAYTMVNILNLGKRDFLVSKIIYTVGLKTIRYMLLLMLGTLFIDISLLDSLMLSGYILFAALIWEAVSLVIFKRFRLNLYDRSGYVILLLILLLAICYLLPYQGIILKLRPFMNSGYLFSLLLILAAFSLWRLYSFKGYSAVTKKTIRRERLLEMEDLLKNAAFADVNLAEKKLVREKVSGTDHLQGYALFNHLFFARHRRIITKPVRIKVAIVAALALCTWIFLLLKPEYSGTAREILLAGSSYLLFVMYLLSSGEKFSRALFFNCDRYMLKERYYKDKKAILSNFTLRLKKATGLNLLPAAAVAIFLLGTGAAAGMGAAAVRLLPMIITVFSLSLFFSTHYLFIYYIMQPYTVDLTQKSLLYSVVNWLIYLICFGCVHIKTTSLIFTFGVIFFTLFYTAAAIILTRNLAPRTFKLR